MCILQNMARNDNTSALYEAFYVVYQISSWSMVVIPELVAETM
jgi:hypothetical protein